MAAPPTPGEMREYLGDHVDADLMFVWSEAGVGLGVQYHIGMANYTSLRKFVGIEDSRYSFRAEL